MHSRLLVTRDLALFLVRLIIPHHRVTIVSLALASTLDEYVTRTLTAVVGADNVGASLSRSTSKLRAATLQAPSTMFQHGLGGVARPSEHLEAWLNGWRFRLKQGSRDRRHRRKNIFRGCKTLFYHLPGLYPTGPNHDPGHRGMW